MPALIIRGFKLVQNCENNFLALIRGRIKLEKLRYAKVSGKVGKIETSGTFELREFLLTGFPLFKMSPGIKICVYAI